MNGRINHATLQKILNAQGLIMGWSNTSPGTRNLPVGLVVGRRPWTERDVTGDDLVYPFLPAEGLQRSV
jgi:hypothetical protein